ncbi:MAG: phosphoribulokinase [Ruminococcaceae bacterium]|nr:phosphoribulokinase [Oscillospiraceae bacterium]
MDSIIQRIVEAADALKSKALSDKQEKYGKGALPVLIAIDGRCASGKTTLALELKKRTGGSVFHMDHFFLRPEQRTEERLNMAGENIDHERFLSEVLLPLKSGEKIVRYRPFDCKSGALAEPLEVKVGDVCFVEGSYSCHLELRELYDLRVFLTVSKEEQMRRIVKRNGEKGAEAFRERWIPLEEKYFEKCGVEDICDMRFELS